jgi:hypothetical protein
MYVHMYTNIGVSEVLHLGKYVLPGPPPHPPKGEEILTDGLWEQRTKIGRENYIEKT